MRALSHLFALVAIVVLGGDGSDPTPIRGAQGGGALALEAAPEKLAGASALAAVRLANTGDAPVTGITVRIDVPPGIAATVAPPDVETLQPGGSMLLNVTSTGLPERRPAAIVVRAEGMSGAVPTAAVVVLEHVAPEDVVTLALTGNTKISDRSAAELRVVVTNTSDAPVTVTFSDDDAHPRIEFEPTHVTLQPRATRKVAVTVHRNGALRRGTLGVVVHAAVTTAAGEHITDVSATRELDVSLAADQLPDVFGVNSVLLVPGLIALLVWFDRTGRDRRRIGLQHPGAKKVWEEKSVMVVGLVLSVAAVGTWFLLTGHDLSDTPELSDVVVLAAVLGGGAFAAAGAYVANHRRSVPLINHRSTPEDVLRAVMNGADHLNDRKRFVTPDDKYGLFVQWDRDAVVLTPPIVVAKPDTMLDALRDPDLDRAVAAVDPSFRGRFVPAANDIKRPQAFETATEVGTGILLDYVDE